MTQKTPAPDTSSQTKQATAKPAADKDKAKPASRLRSWLIGPAMAAIIGGAAYYVLLEPAPTPPAAVATSHYKANATKADTLDTPQGNFTEVELEELMEAQQQAKRARLALREDIKSNRQRLDELSQQMEELKQAFEQMHANGSNVSDGASIAQTNLAMHEVAALRAEIENLKRTYNTDSKRYSERMQLTQLLDTIAAKARDGESYQPEMQQFLSYARNSGLNEQALSVLDTHAESGPPSLALLLERFNNTMEAALPVSLLTKENPTIADSLRGRLSHIVSIRKLDVDSEDNSDEAQLSRASAELQAGNVDMALTHLSQLSDATQELFSAWRGEAETYLDVQDALGTLRTALQQPNIG